MALEQDVRTASAIQNQNSGRGTSARMSAIARVCSDFRCRSSQSSLCKSSRVGRGGPSRHVTSQCATLHSGIHFASCSVEPCSPVAFWLRNHQQRSSNNVGSQTVGSRRSGTEPPREEIACASRPLGTRRVILSSRPSRNCPALANAADSAALRNGTDGATAAVVSPEHKVASVPRNTILQQKITAGFIIILVLSNSIMYSSHATTHFNLV